MIFDTKVLAYSASAAGYRRVLVADDFEILILSYLYKGNCGVVSFDNSSVELEVVGRSETLAFLGHKLRLFQACLFFFSEIVVSDKEGVVSL